MEGQIELWIPIVSIIFGHILFGVIILAWWRTRMRRMELQAEVQTKLIERFGTSAELVEFLKTKTGREFVNGVQRGSVTVAHERALGGIRKAIVLTFLGVGLLAVWGVSGAEWLAWFGMLFVALGMGYLVAAFVSMRMSREAADQENAAETS